MLIREFNNTVAIIIAKDLNNYLITTEDLYSNITYTDEVDKDKVLELFNQVKQEYYLENKLGKESYATKKYKTWEPQQKLYSYNFLKNLRDTTFITV